MLPLFLLSSLIDCLGCLVLLSERHRSGTEDTGVFLAIGDDLLRSLGFDEFSPSQFLFDGECGTVLSEHHEQ